MTDEHIALLQRVEQCAPNLAGQVRELIQRVEMVEHMPEWAALKRCNDNKWQFWPDHETDPRYSASIIRKSPWEALNYGK